MDLKRVKEIQNELKTSGIKIEEIEKLFYEIMSIASRNFDNSDERGSHVFRSHILKNNRKKALDLAKNWVGFTITALEKKNRDAS